MNLQIEHEIAAPIDRVEAAVLDPVLPRRLPEFVPAVAGAHELSRDARGHVLERTTFYRVLLPAPLAAVLPRDWATWIERTRWDRWTRSGTFTSEAQLPPRLRRQVTWCGLYELHGTGGGHTRRVISGTLEIAIPVLGRRVETSLARVISRHFAGESALLAALARGAR